MRLVHPYKRHIKLFSVNFQIGKQLCMMKCSISGEHKKNDSKCRYNTSCSKFKIRKPKKVYRLEIELCRDKPEEPTVSFVHSSR
jgi:hypothetical protein